MTAEKQKVLSFIHGVSNESDWEFCESCADWFPIDETDVLTSRCSLETKVKHLIQKAQAVSNEQVGFEWVLPFFAEHVNMRDFDSGTGIKRTVPILFLTILEEGAHFFLNRSACAQCPFSYVLFMALWRDKSLRHLFPFVTKGREQTFNEQIRMATDIAATVTAEVADGATPTEFLKEVQQQRKKALSNFREIIPPEMAPRRTPLSGLVKPKATVTKSAVQSVTVSALHTKTRQKKKSGRQCL